MPGGTAKDEDLWLNLHFIIFQQTISDFYTNVSDETCHLNIRTTMLESDLMESV